MHYICLVSAWMHNRSPQRDYRAGATSSYKLVAETVLIVAILRALMLVIGTSVTTADVHLEVPQVLSNALSGTIKDITLL